MNSGIETCCSQRNALVKQLNAALPKVKALYESGKAKPIEDLGPAGGSAESQTGGGTGAGAAAESACSAADLRKALTAGDETFLNGLADKVVVVQGMLLKPPKAEGGIALAEIMAGGGSLSVAFPPNTQAASLPMATKVVVTGVAVKIGERWHFKANSWGKASDVEAGRPATTCTWAEAGDSK